VEWTERNGERRETTETVAVESDGERFDSPGVRKAVLLTRYATLLKNWTRYERGLVDGPPAEGIAPPAEIDETAPREQESEDIRITAPYTGRVETFREHFATEAEALDDDDLGQELDLMATILDAASEDGTTTAGTGTMNDDGTESRTTTEAGTDDPGTDAERTAASVGRHVAHR
jgi:Ca-activated chloride channel family protein